ncbi:MAG: glycosyltransferase family 4 protein [Candidatus Omnitrophica bacterium]|nr:glycosyltransferase family 4 protein [Candidatus Omnitrophota bacterium]
MQTKSLSANWNETATDMTTNRGRVKVLRIIARLNVGGPATHVILLTSGLNKERFLSYLVTGTVADGEGDLTGQARQMGVDPLVISELSREIRIANDMRAFFKLYNLIRKIKPDIVHTHTAKAGVLGRAAAILNKVPITIHTFHGHIFHSYFGRAKTFIFITIEKILALFTSRIVVISNNQLNDVRDTYRIAPVEKCSVIPLGLNLRPYLNGDVKDNMRKQFSLRKETLLVGIVGRLEKVKNHRMFLEAARRVISKDRDIDVRFLIVGDGTLRGELEAYAKELKIDDKVFFTGWAASPDLIYKDLDIVCLTSLNEGTPISLIEAMASSKPVVATGIGGVSDVVVNDDTGLLSPSGDVEGFSDKLLKLLRSPDMRIEMGKRGKAAVSERFSKERLFKDIEALYEEELIRRGIS